MDAAAAAINLQKSLRCMKFLSVRVAPLLGLYRLRQSAVQSDPVRIAVQEATVNVTVNDLDACSLKQNLDEV